MQRYLAESDPGHRSRNKFRLRRASPHAGYELQLGRWRVFYHLLERIVEVVMIGEKKGDLLYVGGEEFRL